MQTLLRFLKFVKLKKKLLSVLHETLMKKIDFYEQTFTLVTIIHLTERSVHECSFLAYFEVMQILALSLELNFRVSNITAILLLHNRLIVRDPIFSVKFFSQRYFHVLLILIRKIDQKINPFLSALATYIIYYVAMHGL